MSNSRDFLIRILGDSESGKKAVDEFNAKLEEGEGKLKGFFDSFAGNLAADLFQEAAAAAGDFVNGAIGGASDLSETLSKSSAIFGDQSAVIEQFGSNAAKNVGLSKEAAIAAAAGFGDMFLQLGFVEDQAAAMSQSVVIAAADLGSFSNLETADVADRISAAFRGEYDSLQAVIPNINAARVESVALAESGKTLASELTEAEKATAVMSIVMQDGERAMGDFAKTSDGAANQEKILTAMLEDQQATLGQQLLPAWTTLQGVLIDAVLPALSATIGWLADNQWVFPIVAGGVLAIAAAYTIWSFATGAWTVAQIAANMAMLASPITWIIIGIVALVAGLILLIANWDAVVAWVTNVWAGFLGWFDSVMAGFVEWWNGLWEGIGDAWSTFWGETVPGIVKSAWNSVLDWIEGGVNGAIDLLNGMLGGVRDAAGVIGIEIGEIPHVSLPKLATGGVTSGPMAAIIGDNPGGQEVVQPLSSLRADRQADIATAVRSAVMELGGSGGGGAGLHVTNEIHAPAEIDVEQLADLINDKTEFAFATAG